ncbi:MAG: transcription elongation factor Spt5 [Methanosarcinaceae archaeon]|nr:transcription elongation factor Spt5 [Methanosarcinaceae archaeon]
MSENENQYNSKIYVVKTTANKEKSVIRSMEMVSKKENLEVRSLLAPEDLKGYVFVETPSPEVLDTLLMAIPHARQVLTKHIYLPDVETFLKPKPISAGISEGSIVEITSGPFRGEKARVKRLSTGQQDEITLELFDAVVPIPITIRSDTVRVLKKEEL